MSTVRSDNKVRLSYITAEQKSALIEFLKSNEKLQSGKLSASFTAKDAQRMWIKISEELHKIPGGAIKDWKQWRKTWQDMRNKVKSKNAKILRHQRTTGGGPLSNEQLTSTEEEILNTLNPTLIIGHAKINEPCVSFVFNDMKDLDVKENEEQYRETDINENFYDVIDNNSKDPQPSSSANNNEERRVLKNIATEVNIMDIDGNETSANDYSFVQNTIKTLRKGQCKTRRKINVANQKLNNSIKYANNLLEIACDEQKLKKEYYEKKLLLLKRDVIAKEKIGIALENISNYCYNSI